MPILPPPADFSLSALFDTLQIQDCLPVQREKNREYIESENPSEACLLGQVKAVAMDQYDARVTAACAAAVRWRSVPAPARGELVRQIGARLRALKTPLGQLVALETGKIVAEGEGEVQEMIDMADFAVGQSRMLYGRALHSERPCHRMYEQWHPLGVVGVITAFNFPVAVWAWNAFLAIIAGNAVIWKPSPKAVLCAQAVHRLCCDVVKKYHYPPVFSLLCSAQHALTASLAKDRRIPLISLTGSTSVGQQVNQWVSQRLGRCLLELSGNNAVIIDQTADIDLALRAVLFGAVGTGGQRCTSTRRVYVHVTLWETFVQRLSQAYQHIRLGHPLHPHTHMGPLIDRVAVMQFQAVISDLPDQAVRQGYGGQVLEGTGHFVQPTWVQAQAHWSVLQREHFVPILFVMPYRHLEEAIDWNNQVAQGLSSSLFTRDLLNTERFLSYAGSDCGIANVNLGTSGAEIGGAFGGEKETGGGREAGSDAWKGYMRRQTVTINWGKDLPLAQGIDFSVK